jgi:quercetin dioxygenase-like cupin family protein
MSEDSGPTRAAAPPNIADEFIVVDPDHSTTRVSVSPNFFEELAAKFGTFEGHVLVSSFEHDADWPSWEIHPAGDEIVVLLSGAAEFVLETEDGEKTVQLAKPGDYVIVPKGTWHTARVSTPTRALFITPGAGTQNRDA